jgi:hypothetical protein
MFTVPVSCEQAVVLPAAFASSTTTTTTGNMEAEDVSILNRESPRTKLSSKPKPTQEVSSKKKQNNQVTQQSVGAFKKDSTNPGMRRPCLVTLPADHVQDVFSRVEEPDSIIGSVSTSTKITSGKNIKILDNLFVGKEVRGRTEEHRVDDNKSRLEINKLALPTLLSSDTAVTAHNKDAANYFLAPSRSQNMSYAAAAALSESTNLKLEKFKREITCDSGNIRAAENTSTVPTPTPLGFAAWKIKEEVLDKNKSLESCTRANNLILKREAAESKIRKIESMLTVEEVEAQIISDHDKKQASRGHLKEFSPPPVSVAHGGVEEAPTCFSASTLTTLEMKERCDQFDLSEEHDRNQIVTTRKRNPNSVPSSVKQQRSQKKTLAAVKLIEKIVENEGGATFDGELMVGGASQEFDSRYYTTCLSNSGSKGSCSSGLIHIKKWTNKCERTRKVGVLSGLMLLLFVAVACFASLNSNSRDAGSVNQLETNYSGNGRVVQGSSVSIVSVSAKAILPC